MATMEQVLGKISQKEEIQPSEREKFILELLPQVNLIVRKIYKKLPPKIVEFEDLTSTGTLGLIEAVDKFDKSREIKLKTYAEYKIRGAILDLLRKLDWANRKTRKKQKEVRKIIEEISKELGENPESSAVANRMQITTEQLGKIFKEIERVRLKSIDTTSITEEEKTRSKFHSTDPNQEQVMIGEERKKILLESIDKLDPLKKKIILYYFFQDKTLKETAEELTREGNKMAESRVSQIKTEILTQLRTIMTKRGV